MPKVITRWQHDPVGRNGATGEILGPSDYKLIAQPGGLTQFGAHVERLPPGSRSAPRHWHENEDEMVLVIEGEVILVEDRQHTLRAGDAAAWKAGSPTAHRLENRGIKDAVYLVVGTKAPEDTVHFSDHDVVLHLENGRRSRTRKDGSIID